MAITHGKKIREHLGFLGYEVEDMEDLKDESSEWFVGRNQRGTTLFKVIDSGFTLISSRWGGLKKKVLKDKNILFLLNRVNQDSFFGKWMLVEGDSEAMLVVETVYEGYEKKTFIAILEQFEREIDSTVPEFQSYVK